MKQFKINVICKIISKGLITFKKIKKDVTFCLLMAYVKIYLKKYLFFEC